MKKYLVIGNPINHSLSPKIHNYWLKQNNINAIYDKIRLEENEIKNFINRIKNQEIAGCNVTVPFKKKVIPFLDELSSSVGKTQSVNTITLEDGNLIGHNTDISGFDKAIKSLNFTTINKKVLILGAGGVVSSIIFALTSMNISKIMISNRTREKAENIKNIFNNIEIVEWGDLPDFDVVINATSIELKKETLNIDFTNIGKNKLFYDLIYNPSETNFLKVGKKLGNKTENGKLMFIYQAQEAFKLWHGINPKIDSETLKIFEND